jgi:hypothetical protein
VLTGPREDCIILSLSIHLLTHTRRYGSADFYLVVRPISTHPHPTLLDRSTVLRTRVAVAFCSGIPSIQTE